MEVMGLMLGEYVDEFTISVVDVFSMPQCGNSVSVESIDPVYQATMLDMIRRVNRPETVVGWYHSHPGFGCWLSGIDISTQESFERLDERAVGLVIDPIQSVKGTVVIDCFRLIHKSFMFLNLDPRQINSNIGNCVRPNVTALIHGLNKHYFSLVISYNRNKLEQNLLLALMKNSWIDDLKTKPINEAKEENIDFLERLEAASKAYISQIEEITLSQSEIVMKQVERECAKKKILHIADQMIDNITIDSMRHSILYQIF